VDSHFSKKKGGTGTNLRIGRGKKVKRNKKRKVSINIQPGQAPVKKETEKFPEK